MHDQRVYPVGWGLQVVRDALVAFCRWRMGRIKAGGNSTEIVCLYEKCSPCFAAADSSVMCNSDVNIYIISLPFHLDLKVNWAAILLFKLDGDASNIWFPFISVLAFLIYRLLVCATVAPVFCAPTPPTLSVSYFFSSLALSFWFCFSIPLWVMANESAMREYAGGGMGTFREMAVSGQTSLHQDRKWL